MITTSCIQAGLPLLLIKSGNSTAGRATLGHSELVGNTRKRVCKAWLQSESQPRKRKIKSMCTQVHKLVRARSKRDRRTSIRTRTHTHEHTHTHNEQAHGNLVATTPFIPVKQDPLRSPRTRCSRRWRAVFLRGCQWQTCRDRPPQH